MNSNWQRGILIVLVLGVALVFGSTPASALHDPFPVVAGNGYVEDACHDFSKCGYNGPLIWNPYTVVASGLAWTKKHWETPILHGTRGASYLGQNDMYDQKCINELISGNGRTNDGAVDPIYGGPYKAPYSAWPVPEAEWLASLPRSTDVAIACSTPGSMCDPGATPGATYPNIWLSNQATTQPVPNPNNYGAAANAGVNNLGQGTLRCLRTSFKLLIMGNMGNGGQTNNTANRLNVVYARNLAGSLIWDFSHRDAFKNSYGDARVTAANAGAPLPGKRDSEFLSEPDALANVNAWYDAGYSRGLGYDLYSLGLATFANGLLGQIGGRHYATNGLRKMNIYNPETNTFYPRPHPCHRKQWEADRYGVTLGFQAITDGVAGAGLGSGESLFNPPSMALNGIDAPDWYGPTPCNQHDSGYNGNPNSADPSDPSDGRYWVWYPAASLLPNGMVVRYGGEDQDESVMANTTVANNRTTAFGATTIQVPVIDLYDPRTDTQIALENARKVFPLYPMSAIRETGPRWSDWDFCAVGGESAPATEAPLPRTDQLDEAQHWRDFCAVPGCAADTRVIRTGAGGPDGAAFDCLDLQAAAADPNVNVPAESYWTRIDRAHNRYPYSHPMIDYTVIGDNGKTKSHKLFLIGGIQPVGVGDPFQGTVGRLIEMIELSDGAGGAAIAPKWSIYARLVQSTSASHALALPDGNIFSSGGGGAGAAGNQVVCGVEPIGGPCHAPLTTYEAAVNLRNQIICVEPATYCEKGPGSVQVVGQMTVPRAGIHGVYHLLPTGEPLQSAYDRAAITRAGTRMFTPGDTDLAITSSQIFTPPYLYDSSVPCPTSFGCKLAKRPVIHKGPDFIQYGTKFKLEVGDASAIKMVSLIRTGSATHTLAQDQLYVRVPFKVVKSNNGKDNDDDDRGKKGKDKDKDNDHGKKQIEVTAPTKPVQAKPGDYMLFIVNDKGVPSIGKHVRIEAGGKNENYVHLFTKRFPGEKKAKGKDHDRDHKNKRDNDDHNDDDD